MLETDVRSPEQLVERASQIAPTLKKNASWTEENRRLHDETLEALADAGVFRLRVPKRYGGYEADTRTLVEVGAVLGQADASPSWVASVYWIPTWMAGLFPDEVQDEVFATPERAELRHPQPECHGRAGRGRHCRQREVGLHERCPSRPLAGNRGGSGHARQPAATGAGSGAHVRATDR
nr:acyl-CoA dehydrogenase family protein [Salinispora arenicola]